MKTTTLLRRKDAATLKLIEKMSIMEKLSIFVIVDVVAIWMQQM